MILDLLGEGGGGTVYAAFDPNLGRRVALKTLRRPSGRHPDDALREARLLACLNHANIAKVHDVGWAGDIAYLTMELIEGGDLARELKRGGLSLRHRMSLLLQAGRGLAAAHEAGVVHGDFKPANVLVGAHRVRIIDFGIGRALTSRATCDGDCSSASTDEATPTDCDPTGALGWGTAAYAAPELFDEAAHDEASDIYAFCVSLYAAVYGVLPHRAATQGQLRRIKLRDVRLPRTPRLPRPLHSALLQGLAPQRADRPQMLAPVLEALERATGRRRRVAMKTALALATVPIITAAIWLARDPACRDVHQHLQGVWDPQTQEAVRRSMLDTEVAFANHAWSSTQDALDAYASRWVDARTQTCTHARGEGDALLDDKMACYDERLAELAGVVKGLSKADRDAVLRAPEAARQLRSVARCGDDEFVQHRAVPGRAMQDRGTTLRAQLAQARGLRSLAKYEDAYELAMEALRQAELTQHDPWVAEASIVVGQIEARLGQPQRGLDRIESAARNAEVEGADELAATGLLTAMSLRRSFISDAAGALALAPHVEVALSRAGANPSEWAAFYSAKAACLRDLGQTQESMQALRQGIEAAEQAGNDPMTSANLLLERAELLELRGEWGEALALREEALTLRTRLLGALHPRTIVVEAQIAAALDDAGRHETAVERFARVRPAAEGSLGPEHPVTLMILANHGAALGETDPSKSLEVYQLAKERADRAGLQDLPIYPSIVSNLAASLGRAGREAEAAALAEQTLPSMRDALGADHPWVTGLLQTLGASKLAVGDHEASAGAYRRALRSMKRRSWPQPESAEIRLGLARALQEAQQDDIAKAELAIVREQLESMPAPPLELLQHLERLDAE